MILMILEIFHNFQKKFKKLYLALKRKETLSTLINFEGIMLGEIRQSQKDKCCMILLI